ncbi:MAG: hypothetical protein WAM81_05260, partial [Acidimicrobiia bacterium]
MQVRDLRAEARERHLPLKEAAEGLRQAAAGTGTEMADALERVSAALTAHIALTEGPDGVHAELLAVAPRLANDIRLLTKDHGFMECLVDTTGLVLRSGTPDGQVIGEHVNRLLDRVARHRLRDADM